MDSVYEWPPWSNLCEDATTISQTKKKGSTLDMLLMCSDSYLYKLVNLCVLWQLFFFLSIHSLCPVIESYCVGQSSQPSSGIKCWRNEDPQRRTINPELLFHSKVRSILEEEINVISFNEGRDKDQDDNRRHPQCDVQTVGQMDKWFVDTGNWQNRHATKEIPI